MPDAGDIGAYLLAVGRAHVVEGVDLAGALVGTAFRTYELHLDTEFVEQVFVVHHLGAHAAEVDHAAGVQRHDVGRRAEVVARLRIARGIAHDGLAARLEVGQGLTQLGERAPREGVDALVGDVDGVDVLVGAGGTDGGAGVDEAYGVDVAERHLQACACAVAADGAEVDLQYAADFDHRGVVLVHLAERHNHADERDEHQQSEDCRHYDDAQRAGQHRGSETQRFFLLLFHIVV